MLADKLNMVPDEAERWIVNLIRNARLDAKIDSKLVGINEHLSLCHSARTFYLVIYFGFSFRIFFIIIFWDGI